MAGAENVLVLGPIVIPWWARRFVCSSAHYNRAQRWIALAAGILACLCSMAVLAANLQPQSVGVQVYRLGGGWLRSALSSWRTSWQRCCA